MRHLRTVDIQKWRYLDFPPRPIKREVIFSLIYHDGALCFVNTSDDTLDVVSTDSCGFAGHYDLDFVFGLTIFIESKNLGKVKIIPSYDKGGAKAQELLFADMSSKRFVHLEKLE